MAASSGEPWGEGDPDRCVFCHPEMQPGPLLETDRLRLLPDLYPVVPGHVLVISTEHLPCFGAASDELLAELDHVAGTGASFLKDVYGVDPVRWENGGAGQTVFHAHLHLMPIVIDDLIDTLAAAPDSVEIGGWADVADHYRRSGAYHYAEAHGRRHLLESNGVTNWEFRRLVAVSAGFRFVDGRVIRPTTRDDVDAVAARWRGWHAAPGGSGQQGP